MIAPARKYQAVYPRSRGEQFFTKQCFQHGNGLSPLSRGTGHRRCGTYLLRRFIPALAGNSALSIACSRLNSVYPRSRGEQVKRGTAELADNGLSPLARGTVSAITELSARVRFIPARAGNSVFGTAFGCSPAVYPRSRGEQTAVIGGVTLKGGLSPLARGTDVDLWANWFKGRFIPARAGNRPRPICIKSFTTVYPRSRGEQRD